MGARRSVVRARQQAHFGGAQKSGDGKSRPRATRSRTTKKSCARDFKFLDYAPIVFVSAKTGERTEKLFDLIDRVADARRRRISTGELNRWLAEVDLDRGTSPAARR